MTWTCFHWGAVPGRCHRHLLLSTSTQTQLLTGDSGDLSVRTWGGATITPWTFNVRHQEFVRTRRECWSKRLSEDLEGLEALAPTVVRLFLTGGGVQWWSFRKRRDEGRVFPASVRPLLVGSGASCGLVPAVIAIGAARPACQLRAVACCLSADLTSSWGPANSGKDWLYQKPTIRNVHLNKIWTLFI